MTVGAAVVEWKLGVLLGGSWELRFCVSSCFRAERKQQLYIPHLLSYKPCSASDFRQALPANGVGGEAPLTVVGAARRAGGPLLSRCCGRHRAVNNGKGLEIVAMASVVVVGIVPLLSRCCPAIVRGVPLLSGLSRCCEHFRESFF